MAFNIQSNVKFSFSSSCVGKTWIWIIFNTITLWLTLQFGAHFGLIRRLNGDTVNLRPGLTIQIFLRRWMGLYSDRHSLTKNPPLEYNVVFFSVVISTGDGQVHCSVSNLAGAIIKVVHKVLIVSITALLRDAQVDLNVYIVWDEAGSWPEGQLMQRNTLDSFFVCLFVTLSSLFPMGHLEDFLFKPGYEVAPQL